MKLPFFFLNLFALLILQRSEHSSLDRNLLLTLVLDRVLWRSMGICTSSHIGMRQKTVKEQVVGMSTAATSCPLMVQVIHMDGRIEEYRRPVKAWQVVAGRPRCYVCCSEAMLVDQHIPALPDDEELQPGSLYFLMPLSAMHQPLSLADLCRLAIMANHGMSRRGLTRSRTRNSAHVLPWSVHTDPRLQSSEFKGAI